MLGDDWFNEKYGQDNVSWNTASIDSIIDTPRTITQFSPTQVMEVAKSNGWSVTPLGKGSLAGIPYEDGGGFSIRAPNGASEYIQYHPGSGHHGGLPYYKVFSGPNGTIRYYLNGEIIHD